MVITITLRVIEQNGERQLEAASDKPECAWLVADHSPDGEKWVLGLVKTYCLHHIADEYEEIPDEIRFVVVRSGM